MDDSIIELVDELFAAKHELSETLADRERAWSRARDEGDTTSWDWQDRWGDDIRSAEKRIKNAQGAIKLWLDTYVDARIKLALEPKANP